MPTYDHFCQACETTTEEFCSIADRKQFVVCKQCGGSAERIISSQVQRVEPTWLESAKRSFRPEDRTQINDRNDLHRYMRREGIEQIG